MKKVLIVGMYPNIGGTETFIMNYFRHIDKTKVQVDFINMYDHLYFEEEIKSLGGNVLKVTNVKKNPFKYKKELISILKNYDVVHINMLSCANVLPLICAKKAKVNKIIVHSHNSGTPKGLLRKVLDKINKGKIRKSEATFVACSKKAGEWMFGTNSNFSVLNNAIDVDKFAYNYTERQEIRNKLGINEGEILLGHIGRFVEQKNHKQLIEVFKKISEKHQNYKLILVGEGPLEEEIKEEVNKLGLTEKVIFYGVSVNTSELYNAFDIFVLPSLYEGLPLVGVEAQCNGLPCFFSKNVSEEVKLTSNAFFIDYSDEKSIEKILNANLKRNENAVIQITNNRYNIEKEVNNLLNLYLSK
ncbi:MAG: glycosyltransferase family 1 protein [Bacilli bacterium]|nr:glycosyltransferase family 1 protein [Bacilli bacterium]